MAYKLVFDKLKTQRETIEITFDGTNYNPYSVALLKENGLEIPEECEDFDNIKIKDKNDKEIGNFYYQIALGPDDYYFDNEKIKRLKVADGTNIIRDNAISECPSLISVIIPNSVISIGDEAFRDCYNLSSIVISNSTSSIGEEAFQNCSSLTSIAIPNSVTSIGSSAFSGCNSLMSVNINNNPNFILEDNVLYDIEKTCIIFGRPTSSSNVFVIPNTVTSIGAIYLSENIDTVSTPYSIANIFRGTIIISDNPTFIEPNFFTGSAIAEITIPESVTKIYHHAFYDSDKLITVNILNPNIILDDYSFAWCNKLTTINFAGTEEQWNENNSNSLWDYECSLPITINYNYKPGTVTVIINFSDEP